MLNPWIIAGPTAVGKTGLALAVAERVGGEIIGADAFQIYAGLPVLTAQPSACERARIPHHLIGEVPPSRTFDVALYLASAHSRVAEVQARGRRPIIVGGTGLYLRALLRGLADLPPADEQLRLELASMTLQDLYAELLWRDPAGAATIDRQNPRRLIRALEVCRLTGQPFSSFRQQWQGAVSGGLTGILLTRERADLYQRIDERVTNMFAAGVVQEVAALSRPGLTASRALGFSDIQAMLAGELSLAACVAAIQQKTRRYAKRQMTWFTQEPALVPYAFHTPDLVEAVLAKLQED